MSTSACRGLARQVLEILEIGETDVDADRRGAAGTSRTQPLAPPTVMPECRNRSIRRHQQREHVKAIAGVVAYQHGTRPNDVLNIHADIGVAPQPAIDHRLAGPIKGGTVTEQPVVRSSRDHMTLGILHMHDTISFDTERADACVF